MIVMNDVLIDMLDGKGEESLLNILVDALITVDSKNKEAGMNLLGRMDELQRPKPSARVMTAFHIVQAIVDKVLRDREENDMIVSVDFAYNSSEDKSYEP